MGAILDSPCPSSFLSVNILACYSVILSFRHKTAFAQYLETNRPIETKFCVHIIIDKIYVGIVNRRFSQICNRVTALESRQNLVFTQYLEVTYFE